MKPHTRAVALAPALGAALAFGAAGGVMAQSAAGTFSGFSHGVALSVSSLETPVNPAVTDATGTTSFVNGVLQAPTGSLFAAVPAPSLSGGVGSSTPSSGAVVSVSSAAARKLDVALPQAPAPSAAAPLVLNGKVDLDGGL